MAVHLLSTPKRFGVNSVNITVVVNSLLTNGAKQRWDGAYKSERSDKPLGKCQSSIATQWWRRRKRSLILN